MLSDPILKDKLNIQGKLETIYDFLILQQRERERERERERCI